MKNLVQGAIREWHVRWARPALPARLGVYFHALELADHAAFEAAIGWLRRAGRPIRPLRDHLSGRGPSVHLSFDDNYRSWHSALPLLERLGVTATFFVNTVPLRDVASPSRIAGYFDRLGHPGERVPLSRGELREIRSAGHVVGCHGHSHADLGALPHDEAVEEIRVNREILEDVLGEAVDHLSFPFGMRRNFTPALREWCREAGFRSVHSAVPGLQHDARRDRLDLARTRWNLRATIRENVEDLEVDGRTFERLTGRSAVG